jgi:hypothetical protein
MTRKRSELKAGVFVVFGLAVLLGVVLWLGATKLFEPRGRTATFAHSIAQGSLGVGDGSDVKVGDQQVGRIVSVATDIGKGLCYYRVRLDRPEVNIYSDANARVISGMVGPSKVVVTHLGTSGIAADDGHPAKLGGGLDQVMDVLAKTASDANQIVLALRKELDARTPGSSLAKVHQIGDDLAHTARALREQLDANRAGSLVAKVQVSADSVKLATASLARELDGNTPGSVVAVARETLDEARGTFRDARPEVQRALVSIAGAAEKAQAAIGKDLPAVLGKAGEVADNLVAASLQAREVLQGNRENIDSTLDNLSIASSELKSAVRQIRYKPWILLYKPDKKELESHYLYETVRSYCSAAEQLEQTLARLRGEQASPGADPARKEQLERLGKQVQDALDRLAADQDAMRKELGIK